MTELGSRGGYDHHELVRTESGWGSSDLREENIWFVNSPSGVPTEDT